MRMDPLWSMRMNCCRVSSCAMKTGEPFEWSEQFDSRVSWVSHRYTLSQYCRNARKTFIYYQKHFMKIRIAERFAVIPNSVINDSSLSWKAKGLYAYINSKPDDWDFSSERIAKDSTDWRDSVRSWLKELEDSWYLRRVKTQNSYWHFDIEYVLYLTPSENPKTEDPRTEIPPQEKPSTNKTRSTNKEIQNKRENIMSDFDNFWSLYPSQRRFQKQKCLSLFEKSDTKKAISWLQKFVSYWQKQKTDPQYIPHSHRFLSKVYYENPPETITNNPLTSDSKDYLFWF